MDRLQVTAAARIHSRHWLPGADHGDGPGVRYGLILFPFLGFAVWLISAEEEHWGIPAGLLVVVSVASLLSARLLARAVQSPRVSYLGYVQILKLSILFALLYGAWTPWLNPHARAFGYDPQRYFFDAQDLQEAGFNPAVLPPINYPGILFFYGALFRLFGHAAATAAIINSAITFAAALLLVRCAAWLSEGNPWPYWRLGLFCIVPEVVWFDAVTSRETLCMNLFVFAVLPPATYLLASRKPFAAWWLSLCAIPLIGLGAIRPPMLVPAVAAISFLYLVGHGVRERKLRALPAISVMLAALLVVPLVAEELGTRDIVGSGRLEGLLSIAKDVEAEDLHWESNSFGRIIQPATPAEAALFALPRTIAYLAAPLPVLPTQMATRGWLIGRRWEDWESLCASISALLYLAIFHSALSSLLESLRGSASFRLAFCIPMAAALLTVSAGTAALHERYRIAVIPFLWAAALSGRLSSTRSQTWWRHTWVACLGIFAIIFLGYKLSLG